MDEVVVVELTALRQNDLDAVRRREEVEHAVQVHNDVLVEVRDHYVIPDWDHDKQAEICQRVASCLAGGGGAWARERTKGWWRWRPSMPNRSVATRVWWHWTCCTSVPRGGAAAWRAR